MNHNTSIKALRSTPMPQRIARLPRDRRGYPIIATLRRDGQGNADFRMVDADRRFIVAAFDWCGICGLPFGDERRFVLYEPHPARRVDPISHTESSVHEICAYYALAVCPFLMSPKATVKQGPAAGMGNENLVLAGYRNLLGVLDDPNGPCIVLSNCEVRTALDREKNTERYLELLAGERPLRLSQTFTELLEWFEEPDPIGILVAAIAETSYSATVHVPPVWDHLRDAGQVLAMCSDFELESIPGAQDLSLVRRWLAECGEDNLPPLVAGSILDAQGFYAAVGGPTPRR